MSLTLKNLVKISQHGVPGIPNVWIYKTADAIADVNTAGYFNNASRQLGLNDIIFVVHSGGIAIVYVNSWTFDGAVDVTDGLTVTATDSD